MYNCNRCKDKNWLTECLCGCGGAVFSRDKNNLKRNFIQSHILKIVDRTSKNNSNWKGGRYYDKYTGYWRLKLPNYFSSNKRGYVKAHIYMYQEYHKLCMLKWGDVHHIDENKQNNMPWNLQGMMKSKHLSIHKKGNKYCYNKHQDMSNRKCHKCGTKKTRIARPHRDNKTPYYVWHHLDHDPINWYCDNCYTQYRRNKKKLIKI